MYHLQDSVVSTPVLKNETDKKCLFIYQSRHYFELFDQRISKQKKCHFFHLGLLRNLTKINYSRFPLSSGAIMYVTVCGTNKNFLTLQERCLGCT